MVLRQNSEEYITRGQFPLTVARLLAAGLCWETGVGCVVTNKLNDRLVVISKIECRVLIRPAKETGLLKHAR